MKILSPFPRIVKSLSILLFSLLISTGCSQGLPLAPVDPTLVTFPSASPAKVPDATEVPSITPNTETPLTLWAELKYPEWPKYAAWSPDSQQIVYVSNDGSESWISLYDA